MNNAVTIFRTENIDDVPGLSGLIDNLKDKISVETISGHESAVIGPEFAGPVVDIILSDPIQAAKNSAEIGFILWETIKVIKSVGKHLHLDKLIAKLLIIAKSKVECEQKSRSDENSFEKAIFWGPMEIDSFGGTLIDQYPPKIYEILPFAYLMAVIIPIHRGRARTYWYILRADGEILASWRTQTLVERLPDFLKPL